MMLEGFLMLALIIKTSSLLMVVLPVIQLSGELDHTHQKLA